MRAAGNRAAETKRTAGLIWLDFKLSFYDAAFVQYSATNLTLVTEDGKLEKKVSDNAV